MKKLFTLLTAITLIGIANAQTPIWEENFDTASIGKGLEQVLPGFPFFQNNLSEYPGTPWIIELPGTSTSVTITDTAVYSVQELTVGNNAFEIKAVPPYSAGLPLVLWQSETISIPLEVNNYEASVWLYWDENITSNDDFFEVSFTDGTTTNTITKSGVDLSLETSPIKITSPLYDSQDDLVISIAAANNTGFSMYFDSVKVEEVITDVVLTDIYDIQYTTVPGSNGTYPSLMVGQTVTIQGTVTGVASGGYYVQQLDGFDGDNGLPIDNSAWSGIYVANTLITPSEGDIVQVTGTVTESQGKTVLVSTGINAEVVGSGDALVPNMIYGPLEEKYESVLITARFYRVVQSDIDNTVYPDVISIIGIGEGATPSYNILVDDFLDDLDFFATNKTKLYDFIYGIGNYDAGTFRISPRDLSDYQSNTVPVSIDRNESASSLISSIAGNIVINSMDVAQATIYNLSGQLVKQFNVQTGRTEIEMNSGVYIVKLNSGNNLITEKVMVK